MTKHFCDRCGRPCEQKVSQYGVWKEGGDACTSSGGLGTSTVSCVVASWLVTAQFKKDGIHVDLCAKCQCEIVGKAFDGGA